MKRYCHLINSKFLNKLSLLIKEQIEKQVKAIQDKEFNKSIKELEYGSDDDPMLLK